MQGSGSHNGGSPGSCIGGSALPTLGYGNEGPPPDSGSVFGFWSWLWFVSESIPLAGVKDGLSSSIVSKGNSDSAMDRRLY